MMAAASPLLQSRCSEYRFPHLVPSKKGPDSHVPLWPVNLTKAPRAAVRVL